MSGLRVVIIPPLLVLWMVACIPVGALLHYAKKTTARDELWAVAARGFLWLSGVRYSVHGALADARPLMAVTNHLSYIDVLLLKAIAPFRFTPKMEIARWPLIGWLCRLQDAVFVARTPKHITQTSDKIYQALARGQVVLLFPEATTGDGKHLLPFKPAYFSLAETPINNQPLTIQPIAIRYTKIRGLPIDSSQWHTIAWFGDMVLLPHFLQFIALGRVDVELHILPPLTAPEQNRKTLAIAAHDAIHQALEID